MSSNDDIWILWDKDGAAHHFADDRVAVKMGATRYVTLELVARAMHEAVWRAETTEPPAWERVSERVKEEYRRDAQWQLDQYRREAEDRQTGEVRLNI